MPTLDTLAEAPRAVKPYKFNVDVKNEVVENFRRALDTEFVRFQIFYDRSNAAMRTYRFAHVDLVTMIYNRMMTVFGDDIEAVRQSAYELLDMIEARETEVGVNACLTAAREAHAANSRVVGGTIQTCAIFGNNTMEGMLRNVFYPTFADIQNTISTTPNAVIDVLSRGNVLEDEEAILEFLRARYEVIEIQWLGAVSQLLRWETNRFEVDALFLVDEMTMCMANSILDYLSTNARLEAEVLACS
jgi:hypothetical protein